MPIISAGVHIPGTQLGVRVQAGGQSQRERNADAATGISEAAERQRGAEAAPQQQPSPLDTLIAQDNLSRFR